MFKDKYQGGVFELFSGQGNNPVANWKLCGGPTAIYKQYSKEVKGYIYCLEGSSPLVKMQIPENPKQSLGILQRLLVLQVNVPESKGFSFELVISDSEKQKKRLHFSTVHKGFSVNLFHAKIPLTALQNTWSMLFIDLESLAGELFKGISTLDAITLFANCQIRRIFTMKTAALADEGSLAGLIPCSYQFPPNVSYTMCVLNMKSLSCGSHSKTTRTKGLSTVKPRHPAKEVCNCPTKENLVGCPVPARLSDNNSKSEVQFRLHEKGVTPHTLQMKQGQEQKEQKNTATGDHPVETDRERQCQATPEEDFTGSDDDKDNMYFTFQQLRTPAESIPASPGTFYPISDMEIQVQPGFHDLYQNPIQSLSPPLQAPFFRIPRPTVRPPTRCLSPILSFSKTTTKCGSDRSTTVNSIVCADSSGSFSQSLQQEVQLNAPQHKVMDSEESDYNICGSSSSDHFQMVQTLNEGDEEELQMLASLRMEQDEDEYGSSSLSGPQIQQYNMNASTDSSPWTPVSMPNMDLDDVEGIISLPSNPTEWMDVLRPPVPSLSQQRRSGYTQTSQENLIRAYRTMMEETDKKKEGGEEEHEEVEDEEEEMEEVEREEEEEEEEEGEEEEKEEDEELEEREEEEKSM